MPQLPAHGSWHFWSIQAKWFRHSLLLIHSGLQFGGFPVNSGKQEQEGEPFISLHIEFGPQGDGIHGLMFKGISTEILKLLYYLFKSMQTIVNLPIGKHLVNGSPVYLNKQEHTGLWLTTWQVASIPHVPGQGSIHFWFKHARFNGHSELWTHSGRQTGGLPINPRRHEHTAWEFTSLHWLFGPHGDGLQGFVFIGAENTSVINRKQMFLYPYV